MRNVFLIVVTFSFFTMFTNCTSEALNNENDNEILVAAPSNDGKIKKVNEERRGTQG